MHYAKSILCFAIAALLIAPAASAQERDDGDWWEPVVRGDNRNQNVEVDERERRDRDRRGRGRADRDDERRDRERGDRREENSDERWDDDRRERGEARSRRDRGQGQQGPPSQRRRGDDRWSSNDDGWRNGERRQQGKRGRGPAFCRSGEGHPVHGRRWCREKGFGLGGHADYRPRWERERGWEDVIFGQRRGDYDRRSSGMLGVNVLENLLGERMQRRLYEQRNRMGLENVPLRGRWMPLANRDGRVLQLRAGNLPLAELADVDGDRRVDVVVMNRNR